MVRLRKAPRDTAKPRRISSEACILEDAEDRQAAAATRPICVAALDELHVTIGRRRPGAVEFQEYHTVNANVKWSSTLFFFPP